MLLMASKPLNLRKGPAGVWLGQSAGCATAVQAVQQRLGALCHESYLRGLASARSMSYWLGAVGFTYQVL